MKTNVIPDVVDIEVDIRTIPGDNEDEVRRHIDKALGDLSDEDLRKVREVLQVLAHDEEMERVVKLQGEQQALVCGFQKLKADTLAACGGNLFQVSSVQLRQQDAGYPRSFGRQHLLFDSSHR